MNRILSLSVLLLLAPLHTATQAATTNISTEPVLSMSGTGAVRPNLMLLYDNSGSMARNFTPDYVGASITCRAGVNLATARQSCRMGDPPFASSDFNRQYYNPAVRYRPPVYATGASYPSITDWTSVPTDKFEVNESNLRNEPATATNLLTGLPDLRWCDGSGNCRTNKEGYVYPNATFNRLEEDNVYAKSPYYYSIQVAEYCTDKNLTSCQDVAIGAPAPAGFPVPAKVRFCNSNSLTNCQAKYTETYKYPRFGNPNRNQSWFGTITIDATSGSNSVSIAGVDVATPSGTVRITDTAVTASNGTNNVTKRQNAAEALALSIIAKTGLDEPYTACVRSPSTASVPDCADYGITLAGSNMVAVVPVVCRAGATTKSLTDCYLDGGRGARALTLPSGSGTIPTDKTDVLPALFVRTDIVPSRDSYPKSEARTDCNGATCTYNEEMTNYANWYAYYKTRNQMMKTAVGQAFQPIGERYNVGIVSLSRAAVIGDTPRMNVPKKFDSATRTAFYTSLYNMNGNSNTPLRPALHAIGLMYANREPYDFALSAAAIQYPCQQNFAFVTTDGYWNDDAAPSVNNNDNTENAVRFCTKANGCYDGRAHSSNTLADVALYWYNGGWNDNTATTQASLRTDKENWAKPIGAVPAGPGENTRLHMKTFTLGLGIDGLMTYDKDYDAGLPGTDFHKLITGATGCPWNGDGVYVWPDAKAGEGNEVQARVDDLWHAAVNGHGKYYSASDPNQVVGGLRDALSKIETRPGAAAAATTSTPSLSAGDNELFLSTFKTVKWHGTLQQRELDPVTGALLPGVIWSTNSTVGAKVAAASDTRTIYMLDVPNRTLKPFLFSDANMTATEKSWFSDKCVEPDALDQCLTMTPAQKAIVNNGATIVNWLRGQQQHANGVLLRAYSMSASEPGDPATPRPLVLGDIASSKPAYLRAPRMGYNEASYATFKSTHANRTPTLFVGANDGMLHTFNALTGEELWAYAPRITMKKLFKQADVTYGTNHQYTVDGSPEVADVKIGDNWRTVLVAGLNGGGRGYYALDVTNPAAPQALWELCADPTVCSGINLDGDIGLTFGNPQFGTWRDSSGATKWVVFLTSGYNNTPGVDGVNSGSGRGFLYVVDVATGQILAKTGTDTYTDMASTPAGLARITAITENAQTDPKVTFIYGGDNQGRMWRFDFLSQGAPQVLKMGDAGTTQPITTRPDVTLCEVYDESGAVTHLQRVVAFGTGRLLDVDDIANTDVQAAYVLKDNGTSLNAIPQSSLKQRTLGAVDGNADLTSISGPTATLVSDNGWYVRFNRKQGERINVDPMIVNGTLSVVTNIPKSENACSVGGSSVHYQFSVCSGAAVRPDGHVGEVLSTEAGAVGNGAFSTADGDLKGLIPMNDGNNNVVDCLDPTTCKKGPRMPKLYSPNGGEALRTGWRRLYD